MPTLAAPAGATPSLLSLLTPVAASPITPVEGGAVPSFADIVAGLTAPPALPVMPAPTGQALPVGRPEIAGQAPNPVPDVDPLLTGCGWSPELDQPSPPALPTPSTFRPIARLEPGAPIEPVLHAPIREVFRLPVRAAALTSAPAPLIVPAHPPQAVARPELATPGEKEALPKTDQQTAPEIAPTIIMPEQQPAPVPVPVSALPIAPPLNPAEATSNPTADAAAPVASLPIVSARPSAPTAPVETQPGTPPAQAQGDPQPDAQPQPQQQPKPVLAQVAPADMRIAPELARQVAQMIQPALERTAEPQPLTAPPVEAALPVSSTPAPQPIAAPAPAPPIAFQSAPVDLGRAGWVEAMIERIAEMPQVDRREAQIKLLPDMLGKVEVTLVERDERVHVTMNVETSQARQLLTEAAPRLQELAEARGLRLIQSEIGGGTSQDRRAPQDQNQSQTPLRPRSALADEADDTSTPTGERIA